MRRLLLWLIFLVVAVWFGLWLQQWHNEIILTLGNWQVVMPVWFVCLVFLFAWVLFSVARRLVLGLTTLPSQVVHQLHQTKSVRQERLLNQALASFAMQNWSKAEKQLQKVANAHLNAPWLLAAMAACEMEKDDQAMHWLSCYRHCCGVDQAYRLIKARLILKRGDIEEAKVMSKALYDEHHDDAGVLHLVMDVEKGRENALLRLEHLPELKRSGVLSKRQWQALYAKTAVESLKALHETKALAKVIGLWDSLPRKLKNMTEVQVAYAHCLSTMGEAERAQKLLAKALRKGPVNDEIIMTYGLIQGNDLMKQIVLLEQYLKRHGESLAVLLSLARLSRAHHLTDKARHYFSRARRLSSDPAVNREFADLLASLGEQEEAIRYYQEVW